MALSSVYRKYFQKSQVFIYPLLGIQRGAAFIPEKSYIAWQQNETAPEDKKLICVYTNENPDVFESFCKTVLLKHPRLFGYVKINTTTTVFTFDFSDLDADWTCFLEGKYSQMNKSLKSKILNFFDQSSGNYAYVNSYLFPEKHFSEYARLLDTSEELLKTVGELCSKPDLEKEMLLLDIADLENISETTLNLQNNDKN